MPSRMTIGRLAKAAETNVETIRYYERVGLIPPPARTQGGHRDYSEEAFGRLNFIRRARELGFSMEEVRDLLRLSENSQGSCGEVSALASAHIADIDRKLHDLTDLRARLAELVDRCAENTGDGCPLLDALSPRPGG